VKIVKNGAVKKHLEAKVMKRVLTFLAILLLPLSLWAMTPVSDSDLSNVTGQAGVSINADLSMDISIGTMAWGDDNGTKDYWSADTAGGFVGVQNFNLTGLRVRARTETDDGYYHYRTFFIKPITIDVATTAATDPYTALAGHAGTAVTYVRIGLGALQISVNSMSLNVGTGAWADSGNAVSINQIMGSVNLGNMEVYINPLSYVDIFAKTGTLGTGQGVIFALGVVLDRLELGYVSWGDGDGFDAAYATGPVTWNSADTSAGYVGLNGLYLGDANNWGIKVAGTVAIDVYTIGAGKDMYSYLPAAVMTMKNYFFGVLHPTYDPKNLTDVQKGEWLTYVATSGQGIVNAIIADPAAEAAYNTPGTTDCVAKSTSVVHITFPGTLTVNMGSIRSQVCLANVADLTGPGVGVMGDIYLQSFNVKIFQNSWVDIWAH